MWDDQICIYGSGFFYNLIRRSLKLYCLSSQIIIFSFSTHKINFNSLGKCEIHIIQYNSYFNMTMNNFCLLLS